MAAAYEAGRIFALNQAGAMEALDAASGKILWVTALPDSSSFEGPPTALNGLVYAHGTGTGDFVYAVNEADGTLVWARVQLYPTTSPGAPVVTSAAVYVADPFQNVYAFDARTGHTLWGHQHSGSGLGGSMASLYANKLYARYTTQEGGNLILDAGTGAELGTFAADAPPAFTGNQGFFRTGSTLTARDLTTNAVLWQFSGDGQLDTAPIVANGYVYIGSSGGNVYALPVTTGTPVTTVTVGAAVTAFAETHYVAGLVIGNGTLLVPVGTRLVAFANGTPAPSPPPAPPPNASLEAPTGGLSETSGAQIDAAHSGMQRADSTAPPLPKAWLRDLPAMTSGISISTPLVADGKAFVLLETSVYAIDLQTGTDAWSPIVTGVGSHIAYSNHRLFIEDQYGGLTAIDSITGAVQWSVKLPLFLAGPPTAFGGIVYVVGSRFFSTVVAVSQRTGDVLWSVPTGSGDFGGAPAVTSTGLYVVQACGYTYAFDPLTGARLWSKDGSCSSGGGGSTPAVFGGRLYTHDTYVARHFISDATTGKTIRLFPSSAPPAFDGSLGFFLTGSTLQAEDLASGTIRWAFVGDGGLVTSPIVVNGYVYIGSKSGLFYAVSALTGQQAWSDNAGTAFLGNSSDGAHGLGAGEGMVLAVAGKRLVGYGTHAPVVTGMSPNIGSIAGGATVTISGARLTGAVGVQFGAVPASIVSTTDSQITVLTPRASVPGAVGVTVTTPTGTSVITTDGANRFTYGSIDTRVSTKQYTLTNSDGVTWVDLDPDGNLTLFIVPSLNSTAIITANTDLWTATRGVNQDIGIDINGRIDAWKESGGFAGTFSPNAAFVQTVASMTAGTAYTVKLRWKSNQLAPGASIYAGAGAGAPFSPTRLTVELVPTADQSVQTAVSTQQYQLSNSDGASWTDVDATNLTLRLTPGNNTVAVIEGNADLWTANSGYNQDLGIAVNDNVVAWKESGGFAGTFSPNAAFVRSVQSLTGGTSYTIKLRWKTNKSGGASTIFAAAGSGPQYSPTRLTLRLYPSSSSLPGQVSTTQYQLANSDGIAWKDLDTSGNLTLSITPNASTLVIVSGNVDLWTANAGVNQDVGIDVNGTLVAWKESGGFAGTFSPNAAYVQAVILLTGGTPYTIKLRWKSNIPAPNTTIFAGAGTGPAFSATSLTMELPAQ
jgi:outer membrane protein assembly factor BamB